MGRAAEEWSDLGAHGAATAFSFFLELLLGHMGITWCHGTVGSGCWNKR